MYIDLSIEEVRITLEGKTESVGSLSAAAQVLNYMGRKRQEVANDGYENFARLIPSDSATVVMCLAQTISIQQASSGFVLTLNGQCRPRKRQGMSTIHTSWKFVLNFLKT